MASFFDVAFWQQLVATFAGVIVGVPFGLAVDRCRDARANAANQVDLREQRGQLLAAIRRELEFNREQLVAIDRAEQANKIEAAPLSMPILEGTAPLRHNLFDVDLCSSLDEAWYLLRAVDGFQRQHLALLFDPAAHTAMVLEPPLPSDGPGQTTFYLARAPKLRAHLKDAASKALDKVDGLLKRLRDQA